MKKLYDENKSLVNVANSFLKHFGFVTLHPSLPLLDEILNENKEKKIALVLFDGFGASIQRQYQDRCPFLIKGKREEITSVFPPTTVAATTALSTGRYPSETGWLGWQQQFEEYDDAVLMFASAFMTAPQTLTDKNTYDMCPYVSIYEKFSQRGIPTAIVYSFTYKDDPFFTSFFHAADNAIKNNRFSYIYCAEPDGYLHFYGVGSKEVGTIIELLDCQLKTLVEDNPDTLFVVLADHGHKNAVSYPIDEHPDFFSCLKRKHFALEPRAAAFFVKEEKQEEFRILAQKYYGNNFEILDKNEVIKKAIFGPGELSNRSVYTIGDFLLISKGEACFKQANDENGLRSHHAGSTEEERKINISIFNS